MILLVCVARRARRATRHLVPINITQNQADTLAIIPYKKIVVFALARVCLIARLCLRLLLPWLWSEGLFAFYPF